MHYPQQLPAGADEVKNNPPYRPKKSLKQFSTIHKPTTCCIVIKRRTFTLRVRLSIVGVPRGMEAHAYHLTPTYR